MIGPVFIVGAPRTGSTFLYQRMLLEGDYTYFSNYCNDNWPTDPVTGVILSPEPQITYESHRGKTEGEGGPSEASAIFRHWFGGEHPSETRSCDFLPGMRQEMQDAVSRLWVLTGKPLLTKNAWNCFRVKALLEAFPEAIFVWIRRNVYAAASSDLAVRLDEGDEQRWHSATTRDYREIQTFPPAQQCIKQQEGYERALRETLPASHRQVFYEDLRAA